MYCSSCGKSIPDQSSFCLYCGARVQQGAQTLDALTAPPVALTIQGLWPRGGNKIVRRGGVISGWWNEVSRGFQFDISLLDARNEYTISGGTLIAALRDGGVVGAARPGQYTLGPDVRQAEKIARDKYTLWYKALVLRRSDFERHTYQTQTGEKDAVIYKFLETEPIVTAIENYYVYLHIWFLAPGGSCLYKSEWVYWTP